MTDHDDLPTGPMPPLPPPSGSLDRLLHRAHAHRVRRRAAVLGSAAAVLLLAVGLPLALRGDGHQKSEVRTADDGRGTTTTSSTQPDTTTVVGGSVPTSEGPSTTTTTMAERIDPGTCCYVYGKAVDRQGRALAGIYVYANEVSGSGTSTRTAADGTYRAPCAMADGAVTRVVLSGVVLNGFVGDHRGDQNWVPTTVTSPDGSPLRESCRASDPYPGTPIPAVIVTTMQPGGTITGTYDDPNSPPFDYVPGTGGTTASILVQIGDLPIDHDGAACDPYCYYVEALVGADQRYTVTGIFPSIHQMSYFNGPPAGFGTVTVVAGQTTTKDLTAPPPPTSTSAP